MAVMQRKREAGVDPGGHVFATPPPHRAPNPEQSLGDGRKG